jgi:hypothetical protein
MDSDIQATQVTWENEKDNFEEETTKLKEVEIQIANCRVVAPQEGQVVYSNIQSSRSGSEFVVEAGAPVRENQVVLILPDPRDMRVKARINESRINLVKVGMPVSIRIDAFGEQMLLGEVKKVNNYAEAGNWWSSTSKQYATYIQVVEPPPELRVGLTAEVQIHVESRADALQIPVQAVFERSGKTFCLVQKGAAWDTREIVITSTNTKTVTVDEVRSDPLKEGELVVINPRQHIPKFDATRLPALRESVSAPSALAAAKKRDTDSVAAAQGSVQLAKAEVSAGLSGPASGALAAPAVRLLEQYDADRNGRLSPTEMNTLPAELRQRLRAADANNDGILDTAELGTALARTPAAGDAAAGATGGGG